MQKYTASVITAGCLWGLMGLFTRTLATYGVDSTGAIVLRCGIAALLFAVTLFVRDPKQFRIRLKDIWCFIGTGICSLVFFNYCYFNAIQQTSLAVAALLLYTAPVFVMLMSLLCFGEAFTRTKALALLLTFSGCACVTGVFGSSLTLTLSGLLYGLGSGFGYALYSIFGKYAVRKYSSLTITAYTFYLALAASWPLADFDYQRLAAIDMPSIVSALGLGLLCAVLPYLLYTKGLEQIEAGQASILATIEPFVAAAVGVIFFAEALTPVKIIGMGLIFAAIAVLNIRRA